MKAIIAFAVLALSALSSATPTAEKAGPVRYDNHRVVEFKIDNDQQLNVLQTFIDNDKLGLDLWTESCAPCNVQVRIPPESFAALSGSSLFSQVAHRTVIEDIQPLIDAEKLSAFEYLAKKGRTSSAQEAKELKELEDVDPFFTKYHTFDEISSFVTDVNAQHSDLTTVSTLQGQTFEKRDIPVIVVTGKKEQQTVAEKKAVVLHSGIHAREWITPAFATYLVNYLTSEYNKNENVTKLMDTLEFHIIPVLNVDGYIYTHNRERMWRKNRQTNPGRLSCIGTDPNRNFGYKWKTGGSSSNTCMEDYAGSAPFSAPETKAITDYVASLGSRAISYADIHSFSQLWMFPNGFSCKERIPDYDDLMEASRVAVTELKKMYGTSYRYGDICNTIYLASGGSTDHMYHALGVKWSFTLELRPGRAIGGGGFMLNPAQIVPTAKETTSGLLAFWMFMAEKEQLF